MSEVVKQLCEGLGSSGSTSVIGAIQVLTDLDERERSLVIDYLKKCQKEDMPELTLVHMLIGKNGHTDASKIHSFEERILGFRAFLKGKGDIEMSKRDNMEIRICDPERSIVFDQLCSVSEVDQSKITAHFLVTVEVFGFDSVVEVEYKVHINDCRDKDYNTWVNEIISMCQTTEISYVSSVRVVNADQALHKMLKNPTKENSKGVISYFRLLNNFAGIPTPGSYIGNIYSDRVSQFIILLKKKFAVKQEVDQDTVQCLYDLSDTFGFIAMQDGILIENIFRPNINSTQHMVIITKTSTGWTRNTTDCDVYGRACLATQLQR